MTLFIPNPSTGGSATIRQFVAGNYTASGVITVPSTTEGIEIIATSVSGLRFASLNVIDADIFIAPGSNPSSTNYILKLVNGSQFHDLPINGQQWKAIASTGEASVQVWIASAIAINVE